MIGFKPSLGEETHRPQNSILRIPEIVGGEKESETTESLPDRGNNIDDIKR
jgi:hypothetical protein